MHQQMTLADDTILGKGGADASSIKQPRKERRCAPTFIVCGVDGVSGSRMATLYSKEQALLVHATFPVC